MSEQKRETPTEEDKRLKLEVMDLLEAHAVEDARGKQWARLDQEVLTLVRRVLTLRRQARAPRA